MENNGIIHKDCFAHLYIPKNSTAKCETEKYKTRTKFAVISNLTSLVETPRVEVFIKHSTACANKAM